MTRDDLEVVFEAQRGRFLDEWQTFLRFSSISADPAHHDECLACAHWLKTHVESIGFNAQLLETESKPVVYGERRAAPGAPTILFYGHYDVQPPDPVEAWDSPPFEPAIRDQRVYARGAEDNKGQLFYVLKALETLISREALHVTVKVFIEGEEECGSSGLSRKLETWRDQLAADVLLVCDTGCIDKDTPTIIMGLRGLVHANVRLSGPTRDLHSGVHGGKAPNPAVALARLIATLHNDDGSIAVDGFYDGVVEPSERERALANVIPHDDARYRAETGVPAVGGEARFTPLERAGFRPSLDVNGMCAGYTGAGVKTIIPATAEVKLTARIVAGQDPMVCLAALEAHLRGYAPHGLQLEILDSGAGGPGFRLDLDSPAIARAQRVLESQSGRPPAFLWEGASIPAVASLAATAGADPLLVGFGLEMDRIHAPNESFGIEQFRRGFLFAGAFLGQYADAP
ncbi:MAG: M20/M25/M40 family metallo-hydrolase [Verrucomicrobia bacterium]|nr:M20/M25/M40 family metallo-hydrolase [Verrucomicrobiota bacterium]